MNLRQNCLINLQPYRPATLIKDTSAQVFHYEFYEHFQSRYFAEHL